MANNDNGEREGRDWRETLFLPRTEFPMKAGLPQREPEMLARWEKLKLYERLRADAKGREKYTLHDGPPYANGNIHIGTGLNKILKDVVAPAPYAPAPRKCHASGRIHLEQQYWRWGTQARPRACHRR